VTSAIVADEAEIRVRGASEKYRSFSDGEFRSVASGGVFGRREIARDVTTVTSTNVEFRNYRPTDKYVRHSRPLNDPRVISPRVLFSTV